MEEQEISLQEIFEVIKKRWTLIVGTALIFAIVAGILSFFVIKPVYKVTTKAFIGKENGQEAYSTSDINMYQQLLKTYSEVIKTRDLINSAVDTSKYNLTVDGVLSNLSVTPVANTQILEIGYESDNPNEAAEILQNISDEFIVKSKELVPNGNVRIIEGVEVPSNPISPNKTMNIAIAFLLGAILGLGTIFILEYLDNTYKNKEILERELGIPVVGVIPKDE